MPLLLPTSSKVLFKLGALSLALVLAGCGSGDGTDVLAPTPDLGVQPTPGGDGTGAPVEKVNISSIALTDTNGDVTRVITSAGAKATVSVIDEKGNPISNAIVTFAGEGVTFGSTNGAVLTNEAGEASISVKPINNSDTGSYQLTATASYNDATAVTPAYYFTLQSVNVTLDNILIASSTLQSGSNTNITLKTKDALTNSYQNDVTVNFSASCGSFDKNSVVSSNQGDIITTYQAIDQAGNLCEGTQTITITPENAPSARKTVTVNIASIAASSIVYTTANEVKLGASNSGSSSSGQLEFTVYANGRPAANKEVIISQQYAPTDFSFVSLNNKAPQTVKSDSQGKVVVNLYPGVLPGPVEIKATLANDPNISALSKNVSVATGRATQDGVSISMSKNVLAYGVDGDTAIITARLIDRVGNPVPDGTVVSFVSEGGRVQPNCMTKGGVCSVEFSTQNPRPVDYRASVIAYVEGDKSYTDVNGDNKYTAGVDILTRNIGDFFRDDNENNRYDSGLGEFVYKRGASGAVCAASSFSQPNIAGTCDNQLAATLRFQFVMGLAENTPTFEGLPSPFPSGTGFVAFRMFGNSERTVSMASGTTIAVSAVDKTDYSPQATLKSNVIYVTGGEPNSSVAVKSGSTSVSVSIGADGTGMASTGLTDGASLTVEYKNVTCKAEITSGFETVPNIVNLGIGKIPSAQVSYGISYEDCRRGDQIKIVVQSPAPDATKTTRTITVY